jgi:hypothetical protein
LSPLPSPPQLPCKVVEGVVPPRVLLPLPSPPQLPYKVVEVNPLMKGELKWSSYKKVPVLQFGEEVLVGSSAIMSRVAAEAEAAAAAKGSKKQPAGR